MARARRVSETIEKRKRVSRVDVTHEKRERIELVLTEGEADMLIAVMSRIGGDPKTSPRKYAVRISRALQDATNLYWRETDAHELLLHHLMFVDYKQELRDAE